MITSDRRRTAALVTTLVALTLSSTHALADSRFRLTRQPGCDCFECYNCFYVTDLNSQLGFCGFRNGTGAVFVYDGATFTDLPVSGTATALNELGHAAGDGWNGRREAWLWKPQEGLTFLGVLGQDPTTTHSESHALNIHDWVVGESSVNGISQAVLWTPQDGMVALTHPGIAQGGVASDINDSGCVVGYVLVANQEHAFVWTPSAGLTLLPGDGVTEPWVATSINNLGQIAGFGGHPDGLQGFVWDVQRGYRLLGRLGSDWSSGAIPGRINDLGQVIGGGLDDDREWIPFVWEERYGLRLLHNLVDDCIHDPLLEFFGTGRMNNRGQIIGPTDALLLPYLPGDLDEDGDVELNDLATMLIHFGLTDIATYNQGDLDCDADVDLSDLATLIGNYGDRLP